MSREIKFRAWNKDRVLMSFFGIMDSTFQETKEKDFGKNPILMQYTGLKDNHHVDVYEGDLVKISVLEINEILKGAGNPSFEVRYSNGGFIVRGKDRSMWLYMNDVDIVEVVGNIYQNPELI